MPPEAFYASAVPSRSTQQGNVVCGRPAGGKAGTGLQEVGSRGECKIGCAQLLFEGEQAGLENDFHKGTRRVGQFDNPADVLANGLEVFLLPGFEKTNVQGPCRRRGRRA